MYLIKNLDTRPQDNDNIILNNTYIYNVYYIFMYIHCRYIYTKILSSKR